MLLFTEGFDWTTTASNLTLYNRWDTASIGTIGNTAGVLRFGSGSGNYIGTNSMANMLRRPIGQNLASGVLGVAVRRDSFTNLEFNVFILYDTTASVQMGLKVNNDGSLSVFRTSYSNILGTSATGLIAINVWYYIELKWKIANSIASGDVEVYVDGVNVLTVGATADTQNTANAYATHYALSGNAVVAGGNGNINFDDHYLCDLTGGVNDGPLGNMRIQTLFPNNNGNSSQFTGSDGNSVNNYQQVDETALATADYNDGTALNQVDTYAFTDTVASTSVIKGITVNYIAIRTDTDPRSLAPVVRHSGTDYVGTGDVLASSALAYQHPYDTNPGTSSGWTKSDVDSAEFGAKVTV